MIQTPPASWKLIAYWVGATRMNSRAPTFTRSEATCDTRVSFCGVSRGRMYSRQMLRLKRLAAAIDITEAGTRAPMAIAANAKPATADGSSLSSSAGTMMFAP